MEILAIEGLTKNFYLHNLGKTIKSCRDIGFTLHEGEFIGIVGRSGAGKSSILKCINRTYLPLQGTIVYNSQAFGPIDLAQADERQMLQLRRYEIGYVASVSECDAAYDGKRACYVGTAGNRRRRRRGRAPC